MFGNIVNEEQDHWNPMSSNPTIPLDDETPVDGIEAEEQPSEYPTGDNNYVDGDEVEEVAPTPITNNAKRRTPSQKPHVILEKPTKKPKSSTTLVIQDTSQRFLRQLPLLCLVGMVGSPSIKSWNMLWHVVLNQRPMSTLWQPSCLSRKSKGKCS